MSDIIEELTARLGPPVEDVEEETFMLYSRVMPSSSLGFIDPKADSVDVTIRDKEFVVHQSPGLLESSRAGGTTGAVLWKITPLFAEWLTSPTTLKLLTTPSSILELGCGISPLNGLSLAAFAPVTTRRVIMTDQSYVAKLVNKNLEENDWLLNTKSSGKSKRKAKGGSSSSSSITTTTTTSTAGPTILEFMPLDWETDSVAGVAGGEDFDLVIACDCVYNEALIAPLTNTCADACALRSREHVMAEGKEKPTICVVAQQLRDNIVFEAWLKSFEERFVCWRVQDEELPEGLRPDDGFVIFVGVLKEFS